MLAPRDWHCFGLYGSNGSVLVVTPERYDDAGLWKAARALRGPAVQLSVTSGETSGRFEVARVAARLFPHMKNYAQRVMREDISLASDIVFHPYPADILKRPSETVVEFKTPANKDGLGTHSRLVKNAHPISGLAMITGETDFVLLQVRLPPKLADLGTTIMRSTERAYCHCTDR